VRSFKLYWNLHRWTGIILAAVFAGTAVTGFLLLIKKKVAWIQPPTMEGEAGDPGAFMPVGDAFEIVLAQGHPDFAVADDVDRIDVRPGDRVYKFQSKHHYAEIQVDAVTGAVLAVAPRRSDLIEDLHDGSFYGDWFHAWFMPLVAAGLLFLVCTGLWLWIEPKLYRRKRRRRSASS